MQRGDRVRLRPHPRGDIFDLALAGQTARIDMIEQDFEGRRHVVVILDGDPGRAIGPKAPGHRFFFSPEELELLAPDRDAPSLPSRTVLVAGIGNIFMADDGFGVEVAQRLARRFQPPGVQVVDFGIRGYDLACALVAGHDAAILVDACPRGDAPGTVFVIEPESDAGPPALDPHAMDPIQVLRLARSIGTLPAHVVLVGCEPATLGPEEGAIGLSAAVAGAVDTATAIVEELVARHLQPQSHGDLAARR
jgi:hydrogenase maturation protease